MQEVAKTADLFVDKINTGLSSVIKPLVSKRVFHLFGNVSASTGAASVEIQVSNDGTNFLVRDTLALTLGTSITHDYFELDAPWKFVRANVASISGTNAKVTLIMSGQEG